MDKILDSFIASDLLLLCLLLAYALIGVSVSFAVWWFVKTVFHIDLAIVVDRFLLNQN